jgi:hypothetical protein
VGETAALLLSFIVFLYVRGGGFAPRHLSRWAASLETKRRDKKQKMKVLALVIWVLLLFQITLAQTKQEVETPYNCDAMLAIFDNAAVVASSDSNKDSFVIIVAYLGCGEKSRAYNQQRLKALEFHLTKYRGISKERLILTEGRRRNGLGKVEFYIGGKLSDELFLVKRGHICTSCCPSEYLGFLYIPLHSKILLANFLKASLF